jgi:hypothetical protein
MLLSLALAASLLLPAASARADASLGGDFTTGQGYRGYDAKGDLDLDPKGIYSINALYSHVHSTVGTETKSNQGVLGLDHAVEDDWDFRASLTGWKDDISDVKYVGPSFGFSYTLYRDDGSRNELRPSRTGADGERDSADRALVVVYNSDLFFYQTGVNASSETITEKSGRTTKKIAVPALDSIVSLFQFHPTLEFDIPLFGGKVTPSISAGHYFYSKDPGLIEQRAGEPYFASSAGGLNGLVGGLFLNNGQVALDLRLPWDIKLRGTLGAEQSASDNTWSTTQGAALTDVFFDRVKASLSWARSIQDGVPQDLFTGGLTVLF